MLRFIALVVLAFLIATPAHAQEVDTIKQRAAEIQKWRTTLADPDPTVRLAAIEAVLRGKDPSLRALAIDTALNKMNDPGMQAAALVNIFGTIRTIIIEPAQEGGPTLTLTMTKFDPLTGTFSADGGWTLPRSANMYTCGSPGLTGQLTGTRIQFGNNACFGGFKFEAGRQFVGQAKTASGPPFPAHFSIE
jgi:hypothetical protein